MAEIVDDVIVIIDPDVQECAIILDILEDNKETEGSVEYKIDKAIEDLNLLSPWESGESYDVGDYEVYDDQIFACTVANSDTSFDHNKWKIISADKLTECVTSTISVDDIKKNKTYTINTSIEDIFKDLLFGGSIQTEITGYFVTIDEESEITPSKIASFDNYDFRLSYEYSYITVGKSMFEALLANSVLVIKNNMYELDWNFVATELVAFLISDTILKLEQLLIIY